jgi:DNA-3-methyladenine glycosylase
LPERLIRSFFSRPTDFVAREMIGCLLWRSSRGKTVSGRIVETEAYGDETDLASHAALYRRSRSDIMRAIPGTLYVYRIYGIHLCLNIVAHEPGGAGAVLIRALEPVDGIEVMTERRGTGALRGVANGPGRITQALDIAIGDNWTDVVASDNVMLFAGEQPATVLATPRIGISKHVYWLWRFVDPESTTLSRPVPRSGLRASI